MPRTRRASNHEIDEETRQDTLADSARQGPSTTDDRLFQFLEAFSKAQAESNRKLLESIAAQSYRVSDHQAHSTESPVPFPAANQLTSHGGNFVKCTARFDGASQDPETLEAFLDAVLVFKECSSVSDEHALRGLPMLLTGDAAVFYQGVKSSVKSWEDALQRLRAMYGTPRPAYKLFRDIFASEQATERADVFIARLRATISKLPYELEDRVKVDIIYGLLDRRIRKRIPPDAVSTMDQLVEKARVIEESLAESSLTTKSTPTAAGRSVGTTGSTPATQPRAVVAAPQLSRATNAVPGAPTTTTTAAGSPRTPHAPSVPTGQVITARQEEQAATKIQAVFRGHKTRKTMSMKAAPQQKQAQPEPEPSRAELEAEFRADDKDLCHAATKIQASFRGHQARKQTQAEKDKEQQDKEDIEKINLADPDLNKAATKIQASFRGHKVRKDVPN